MKRILSAIGCVCAGTVAALSIPAKPGPISHVQPDGTVVTVTMTGDEFGHMIFSEDGLL